MRLNETRVRDLLRTCDFKSLFVEELGWSHCSLSPITVSVDGQDYTLGAISEMGGLVALQCSTDHNNAVPDYHVRRKIDRVVSKLHYEHIIIYCDTISQVWQWVKREPGKPSASREHVFRYDQSGLPLIQKLDGLVFDLEELDDEGNISIKSVSERVKSALDIDRVTKRFYERFDGELKAFKKFITGITNAAHTDWYASLMLNRLMFVYFIQKKGFLDRDPNYLRNRLEMVKERRGRDEFYSFYRSFLRVLFHDGLNSKTRNPELIQLIGTVPYLNGGLFEEHEIEHESPDLDIPDGAFERVFDFFDQYEWHLDTRPMQNDREINPDVLGYIFEKYINQKQMGAYYTKEDITEYISKNTIIPYLFDAAKQKCAIVFDGEKSVWTALRENPDKYIYDAVKKGVGLPLPSDIAVGISEVSQRGEWNKSASGDYALPTEIWREVVARRQRYDEVKAKLEAGEVRSIDDLITLNLDIRQFAQDVIENTESPDLLRAFWEVLRKMTVLDPTCGSGAFLFAALNILEPLYEGCLGRMQEFVDAWGDSGKQIHPNYYKWFSDALRLVREHSNHSYFIYKSIILNNLFGVDIMPEAVEICKLRLFLKLAAEVEPDQSKLNMGLEPLPDIDFNIRAGNTLVGFATYDEAKKAIGGTLDFSGVMDSIDQQAKEADELFALFRQMQEEIGGEITPKDKQDLRLKLQPLEDELNGYLAQQYGVDSKQQPESYAAWIGSHQPFHWFIEFYSKMKQGGFDVVVGNPPYVEYKDVCGSYKVKNYRTLDCSNLFAFVLERCTTCSHPGSRVGMIVPLSAFCTDRMIPLISHVKDCSSMVHIANFSWRPGKLFDGVNLQLSIVLQKIGVNPQILSTRYTLWDSEARADLFSKIQYEEVDDFTLAGSIPKLGTREASAVLGKLRSSKTCIGGCLARRTAKEKVFYRRGGLYWKVFVDFQTGSSEEKLLSLNTGVDRYLIIAALSSSLWFWYFTATSDCRHLGNRDISTFPFDPNGVNAEILQELSSLGMKYVEDLKSNAVDAVRVYKGTKAVECISFRVKESKRIIDDIDRVLARYFGFTDEELDFIINYDIKYRMGLGGVGEED